MRAQSLMPRFPVPALNLPLTNGERFVLGANPGEKFDLLVFYRGLHCPICAKYLLELERLAPEFASRGVQVVAISSDSEERGKAMAEKVKASGVEFAYDLSLRSAREWDLFISTPRCVTSIGIEETELFSEPGVFIVRPEGTLHCGSTQTMPFARLQFQDLIGAIDFAVSKTTQRGEYNGTV